MVSVPLHILPYLPPLLLPPLLLPLLLPPILPLPPFPLPPLSLLSSVLPPLLLPPLILPPPSLPSSLPPLLPPLLLPPLLLPPLPTRHPDSTLRPMFRDILAILIGHNGTILGIPDDIIAAGTQATVLGAPLEASLTLYSDLQSIYNICLPS